MSNSIRFFKPMVTSIAALVFVSSSLLTASIQANESTEVISVVKKEKAKKHHKAVSFKKYIKRLNLTGEQTQQVTEIRKNTKAEFDLYKNDMKSYKEAKKVLLQSDTLDETALSDLYAQYQPTFSAIELIKTKRMFAMKQMLTDEQFTKLKKMMSNRGKKGKHKAKKFA